MSVYKSNRAADQLFGGAGAIRELCRAVDWASTPLGPAGEWPQGLRMAVRLCLDARFPMSIWAGSELVLIYNEGYPPVLGLGRHPWALGRPAAQVWSSIWDQVGPELAQVMQGESTWHENQRFVIERDSRAEEAFFTYSFTPIEEADGRIVGALNVFTETTEHVRSLGAQEARYRALVDNAGDAIILTDPAGSGKVVSANPAACRLFGYSEEEFRALNRDAILDIANPGRAEATLTYLRKDSSRFLGELRSAYFNDAQGKRLAVSIIRDVTERERAQRALEEQESFNRSLVESSRDCVKILDAAGNLLSMSDSGKRLLEIEDVGPLLGRSWLDFWRPEDRPRVKEAMDTAVRGDVGRFQAFRPTLKGAGRWWDVQITPIERGNSVAQLLVVSRDITELKSAQDEVVRANDRLQEADERKNQFLATLSHELRNPLAPIKNSLYILERAVPGGDQARRAQEVIGRQADQLVRLVNDLLDLTRITRGKIQLQRQPLELNDLVKRTLDDHRSVFDKAGIRLDLRPVATEQVFIYADWNRLAQIVGNLLQNAARFTPSGGRVTVTLSSDRAAGEAIIRVADTGVGIAPDLLGHLFQPFMQADTSLDRSKGGLGLGLALIKALAELHGGTVEARSEGVGRGSEFAVRLPLGLKDRMPPKRASGGARQGDRRRVLIIEDNLDAATSLREMLELQGHEVAVAHDGPGGLAKAREFAPEIVLCDVGLPGMSGYDVARTMRSDDQLESTVLVAVSGYALPEDVQRAHEAGFERHLAKPPSVAELEKVLAETCSAGKPEPRAP